MEPDPLQDKEYEALERESLYLILGGLCLLFITSPFFRSHKCPAFPRARYFTSSVALL